MTNFTNTTSTNTTSTNTTSTIIVNQEDKMYNFEFSLHVTGKVNYLMDEYQQVVCDNGDAESVATEIFDGADFGELEEIDMEGYCRDGEWLTIYVKGYFNIITEGKDEKSAYDKAIHEWEEADFNILEDIEVDD